MNHWWLQRHHKMVEKRILLISTEIFLSEVIGCHRMNLSREYGQLWESFRDATNGCKKGRKKDSALRSHKNLMTSEQIKLEQRISQLTERSSNC